MPPGKNERRYSEEEFTLVLRVASEEEAGLASAPPRDGLTLAQIQEIATEVGIDAVRVARAASLLTSEGRSMTFRLLGGHPRHRMEVTVPGAPQPEDLSRIVDVARRALSAQGETREVLGSLEWKGGTSTASIRISVTPRGEETLLHASVDRTEALAGLFAGLGLPMGGLMAVTLGKLVFGESDAGILAAILSGFPPAFLFVRAFWKRSTRRWKERLLHLVNAMAREAEVLGARRVNGVAEPETGPSSGREPNRQNEIEPEDQ